MRLTTAILAATVLLSGRAPASAAQPDAARWASEAAAVTITRDDWGVAHVSATTDAQTVFGAIFAQAEDDFGRVEANYMTALGRTAEAEGEAAIWRDLRQRLFIDPVDLKAKYAASPDWLKALMDAWADGLNAFLASHPAVKPKVIQRFEPWMALAFSEGSIGGDIERVSPEGLKAFYGGPIVAEFVRPPVSGRFEAASGSNGFAVAPANTKNGHALLLINPHTSFFFRSELQMTSGEGLDAYGATTWGQFFIYQGFNAHAGWMHTSSGVDAVDEFAETITRKDGKLLWRHGAADMPVKASVVTLSYRTAAGGQATRTFTVFATDHGPIVRAEGGKWIAVSLMNRPVEALSQSFLRTKARDYTAFYKVAELKANASNNTIFADDTGEIAYLHPQFIPRRDDRFDYTRPVDGADPAADWKGLHALGDAPHLYNPPNGWIFNTNDWPYSAAGDDSPKRADFPRYMDTAGENPRGVHAALVLQACRDFTPKTLLAAAFDPYQPEFTRLLPSLTSAYDALPPGDPLRARLAGQIGVLRGWDMHWSADSVANTVAIYWGEALWAAIAKPAADAGLSEYAFMEMRATPAQKLAALAQASDRLTQDFGRWRTAWGEVNRFQRRDGAIRQTFDDAGASIPVPFPSSQWGSLASFETDPTSPTKRRYGVSGNSFVALVEFGPRVRALAVTIGGESGHPASPHFDDQALRYAAGDLRPVYFYPDERVGHTERTYHPATGE